MTRERQSERQWGGETGGRGGGGGKEGGGGGREEKRDSERKRETENLITNLFLKFTEILKSQIVDLYLMSYASETETSESDTDTVTVILKPDYFHAPLNSLSSRSISD